jgi:hyperosmotically inducible periplasmic protein
MKPFTTPFATTTYWALLASAIALGIAGCDKPIPTTSTAAAAAPSTTLGTELDDSVITSRVKSALLANPDINSMDFKVETRKGEVQLSGFVNNQEQIDKALNTARNTEGVRKVLNDMSIKK